MQVCVQKILYAFRAGKPTSQYGEQKPELPSVDESRKRVIGIIASETGSVRWREAGPSYDVRDSGCDLPGWTAWRTPKLSHEVVERHTAFPLARWCGYANRDHSAFGGKGRAPATRAAQDRRDR